MMVYVPDDGANARGQILLVGTVGDVSSARAWVRPNGAGDVIAVGPGFALSDTGIDYTPGVWQQWDLEYAVDGSTFSVSVDGATASGLSSFAAGNVAAVQLFNGSNTAGSIYFDAVPLPPAVLADLNQDGFVDIFDVNLVSSHWGSANPAGDANRDGIVDIFDVNLISANWSAGVLVGNLGCADQLRVAGAMAVDGLLLTDIPNERPNSSRVRRAPAPQRAAPADALAT
jgi:hypothetical protein